MLRRFLLFVLAPALLLLGAFGVWTRFSTPAPLDLETVEALYATPAPAPNGPLNVLHLGHSLVGHDMPEMLTQLAQSGHSYNSQIGWGTFLKAHWDPDTPRTGFAESNTHPQYREGHDAVESGEYDALVVTEAVEIRSSIKYMESARMLHNWATKARARNPNVRVYFYETWHYLDDPEGWLERLDRDLETYWEGEILRPALNYDNDPQPIYMIPGGQVMARFVRAVESRGGGRTYHNATGSLYGRYPFQRLRSLPHGPDTLCGSVSIHARRATARSQKSGWISGRRPRPGGCTDDAGGGLGCCNGIRQNRRTNEPLKPIAATLGCPSAKPFARSRRLFATSDTIVVRLILQNQIRRKPLPEKRECGRLARAFPA